MAPEYTRNRPGKPVRVATARSDEGLHLFGAHERQTFRYNAAVLSRLSRVALAPVLMLLVPATAHAQEQVERYDYRDETTGRMAFDVQLFEPSPSSRSITTLDLGSIPSHLSLTMGLWTSYASRPLVANVPEPMNVRAMVGHLFQSELHASLGLFEYFELGLALPVVHTQHIRLNGDNASQWQVPESEDPQDFRLGDLRAYAKIPILRGAWPLAIRLGATFPTGGHDAFSGNRSWTFTPALALSHDFGPVTTAINLGFRFRERNGVANFVLDDEMIYGVGARWAITPRIGINAEVFGRVGMSAGGLQGNRSPLEVLLGGTFQVTDGLALQVGAGRGLSGGYGSPEWRVYAGARLTLTRSTCTNGPEDYDGYQDGDFCADPDNDGDGIADVSDRCPNDREDRDGFLDEDGCQEPDNDADGVLDDSDRCPLEPEDRDGFEDTDGCPEGDNDRDQIPDVRDECPMESEDPDSFQDDDGCPEPGPEAAVVTRSGTHLILSQRIFFDYDSDRIRDVSLPILNELANTLRRSPDIRRVRIEGYTDGVGDADYNLDLSFRRARAVVEYLVSRGIERGRLEFQGYGESHPVASDDTPEGQALNRRVEFTIIDQAGDQASNRPDVQQPDAQSPAPQRRRNRH